MTKTLVLSLVLSLFAIANARAEADREVRNCSDANLGIESIVLPAKSFYNGQVNVFVTDTVEPAAASFGLAIVTPDFADPVGGSNCRAITHLSGVDINKIKSSYDSDKGLLLTVPYRVYNGEGTEPAKAPLKIRINLKKQSVVLE